MMELAARKLYLDSMVYVREQTIGRLEAKVVKIENHYKQLLWNAAQVNDQKDTQIESQRIIIQSQAVQIKNNNKVTRWQKIKNTAKDVVIVVLTAVVIKQTVD